MEPQAARVGRDFRYCPGSAPFAAGCESLRFFSEYRGGGTTSLESSGR